MVNDASACKLKALFGENGYSVIDQAKDGNECLRKIRSLKPDLAVLNDNLPVLCGLEVAKIIVEDKLCDVIIIMSNEKKNTIDCTSLENEFVILTKPLSRESLLNTVELVIKNRRKVAKLEKEIEDLKKTLDNRKMIEKAKGILMKNLGLSEEQVFRRIQKQSMDLGIPMQEIAKAIILADEI